MIIERFEKEGCSFNQDNFPVGTVFTMGNDELYIVISDWKMGFVEVFSLLSKKSYTFSIGEETFYRKVTKLTYEL